MTDEERDILLAELRRDQKHFSRQIETCVKADEQIIGWCQQHDGQGQNTTHALIDKRVTAHGSEIVSMQSGLTGFQDGIKLSVRVLGGISVLLGLISLMLSMAQ